MFSRLLMPVVAFSFAAGCNRGPAPTPEKAVPEQVVPSYQAATPANASGGSAVNGASSNDGNSARAEPSRAETAPEAQALSDAQIARITNDANATEIEQGKLAQARAKDARVKAFADRMVKHHTEAKDKQAKLGLTTAESDLSTKLERESGTAMGALRANAGKSFDQEYLQTQIKEHQQVLDTIEQQLLPNAKGSELKAYLKEIRPTVEAHLKDARELEVKLTQQAAMANPAAQVNQAAADKRAAVGTEAAANKQTATSSQAPSK